VSATFLPERLRPRAQRRRARRSVLLVVLLPATLALTPWWRVQAVDLSGCLGLPSEVTAQLHDLVGRPALSVSPQWVRHQLEAWPEVSAVEVRLELPGTLHVTARQTDAAGSVPVGHRWHAVTRTGELAGALDRPIEPVLEGVGCHPDELSGALAVAERLAASTGGQVEVVREITPSDFEVRLRHDGYGDPLLLHVGPEATDGERYWCGQIARGGAASPRADLRWDDRVVLGGVG
jgi:hypothetical protein